MRRSTRQERIIIDNQILISIYIRHILTLYIYIYIYVIEFPFCLYITKKRIIATFYHLHHHQLAARKASVKETQVGGNEQICISKNVHILYVVHVN